mmetsp:Transcript_15839/g.15986  ORF Transcript_15839/g.15986 Transcript_15839/m.15986 type:complete len:169 (+) Transcript_15839:40-546(+)
MDVEREREKHKDFSDIEKVEREKERWWWDNSTQHVWKQFQTSFQQNFSPVTHPHVFPSSATHSKTCSSKVDIAFKSDCTTGIRYLGETIVETDYNHCLVDCYVVICSPSLSCTLTFSDGEVSQGKWIECTELRYMLEGDRERQKECVQFVPDGLQVWDAMKKIIPELK